MRDKEISTVTRTSRSRVITAAAAFLAAVPALAGCGVGFDANTIKPYAPTEATAVTSRGITISQAFLLGPEPGGQLAPGENTPLYMAITNTNEGTDTLVGATTEDGIGKVKIESPIQLPQNTLVHTRDESGGPSRVVIEKLYRVLTGGEYVTVNLQFNNAGVVPISVPVIPRSREFATFPPAPASESGEETATPSPAPTESQEALPEDSEAEAAESGTDAAEPEATDTESEATDAEQQHAEEHSEEH